MSRDYYNILGISRDASEDEIKKAFRKKAHKFHPDKENGDEERFKEINEAYQVLGDESKRKQYDQFGTTFEGRGGQGGFNGFRSNFQQGQGPFGFNFRTSTEDYEDLGDIFSDLFGGSFSQSKRQKQGRNINIDLDITLKEAYSGTTKKVDLARPRRCPECNGSGAEPGTSFKTCSTCQGQGKVRSQSNILFGSFSQVRVCPECKGKGEIPEEKCSRCRGRGVITETDELKLEIPRGVENGQRIRFRGKGEEGPQGVQAGDLYATINITNSTPFEREKKNLYYDLEVDFPQAALGDKVKVPTMEKEVSLRIPKGIESGKKIRLKGKGMPSIRAGYGDLYVRIQVKTPKRLSRKARKLLKRLQKEI